MCIVMTGFSITVPSLDNVGLVTHFPSNLFEFEDFARNTEITATEASFPANYYLEFCANER